LLSLAFCCVSDHEEFVTILRDLTSTKMSARHFEIHWGGGNREQIKVISLQRNIRTSDISFESLNHPFLMSLILHWITNKFKVFKNDGEQEKTNLAGYYSQYSLCLTALQW